MSEEVKFEKYKVTKLEFHRYVLKPKFRTTMRAGALLRVSFADLQNPGHSDLFPWTEYGDPSLDTWLGELRGIGHIVDSAEATDGLSKTLRIAIQAARDEALATSRKEPLIAGSIMNHALSENPTSLAVGDILDARRATCPAIKIKIGRHAPLEEAAALARLVGHWGIRLRLDANERITRDELMSFLDALPIRIRESLEFVEDPFPFDLRAWCDFHRETGIVVAYDRGLADRKENTPSLEEIFNSDAAQILVHKPAWQDDDRAIYACERGKTVVVTSILGHPIGNIWAASKAAQLAPDSIHGCMSHTAYKDDEASNVLIKSKQARGCRMVGIGIGLGLQSRWFDRLRWETLA